MNKPEWLVHGAEVIVYGFIAGRLIHSATVDVVEDESFTITGWRGSFYIRSDEEFSSEDFMFQVFPVASEEGQRLLQEFGPSWWLEQAEIAVHRWVVDQNNKELRDAAVVALQAIEYES